MYTYIMHRGESGEIIVEWDTGNFTERQTSLVYSLVHMNKFVWDGWFNLHTD